MKCKKIMGRTSLEDKGSCSAPFPRTLLCLRALGIATYPNFGTEKILPPALHYTRLKKQLTTIRKEYITVDLILAVSFQVQQVNATVDLYVCVLLVVQRTVSTEAQLGTSTFYPSDWQVRYQDVVDSNCSGHRPPDDVTRRDVTFHSRQQSSTVQQQGLPGWWWWCLW